MESALAALGTNPAAQASLRSNPEFLKLLQNAMGGSSGAHEDVRVEDEEDKTSPTYVFHRSALDPGLSYHRMFLQQNPKRLRKPFQLQYLCKKSYLQKCHPEAYKDYVRMQAKIRNWFTHPTKETNSLLFCNYKNNKVAIEKCKSFIKSRHSSLGALLFNLENGKTHSMIWKEDDIYEYFLGHKQYYQKIYKQKQDALIEFASVDDRILENSLDPLALENSNDQTRIEESDIDVNNVENDFENDNNEIVEDSVEDLPRKKRKKQKKFVEDNYVCPAFSSFDEFDHLTICQVLIGCETRVEVHKNIHKWIIERKQIHQPYPKIKNINKLINDKPNAGSCSIDNFKVISK
ncbi:hypothetical protein KC19_4G182600 [Ceratodon purpureus]|uniref:Uncharacterized protein n=1 Tax=Ceratodon purpureus TaxID=3225 RepID=A0A8T0IAW5_CERPU|nr:hypothetical protein KC19_4G182600 [Ceratodon purpureus]